ncbi:hypothetical protein FKG94_27205 [Exilibacterium tricleocarpae]|uniref:Uncharacterized protein n=1 Tax=Exilibacterium tricleocarpae TaxID=2591008 RepID=A0A545SN48_9GAMM|nr:hypothetical protein [Exilibacterium tricleocarpae]TQV66286.1 hypothetical protein FKG94_27205 [Exilibacterium tricleocarpae]
MAANPRPSGLWLALVLAGIAALTVVLLVGRVDRGDRHPGAAPASATATGIVASQPPATEAGSPGAAQPPAPDAGVSTPATAGAVMPAPPAATGDHAPVDHAPVKKISDILTHSHAGLVAEPVAGGGEKVNLRGRFGGAPVARRQPDGGLVIEHYKPAAPPEE